MCGIAGVVDVRGRPIDAEALERARLALLHRGPDDSGCWRHHDAGLTAAFVHTRLAVLDLTPAGHQPFADPTGRYHVTYNGEIYNFRALRRELGDRGRFRTECDTELLLAAVATWGEAALDRFNGMWAFAMLDVETRSGWLARDRFGVKPLYYAVHDGRVAFASEMPALLPFLDAPPVIDPDALCLYLALGFIPHPLTIYRSVRKLPPGHVLAFSEDGVDEPRRYFRLRLDRTAAPPDYATACAELRARIGAAVDARRIADVPLGAFLSGGLDSSIVVAEMARGGGTVETFSIGYADEPRYDETPYARRVAERFGTRHHEFRLTQREVLDAIPGSLDTLSEPFADSSLIPTSLVSRHTRQHVTVALSGDGGDELFAGYWRYRGHAYLRRYRRLPRALRRGLVEPLLRLAPSAKSGRLSNRVRQARKLLRGDVDDLFERHAAWARLTEADVLARLLPAQGGGDVAAMLRAAGGDLAGAALSDNDLSSILVADLAFGLPADMLFKVDLASMRHALEVRLPLLDPAVVHYVTGLPLAYKLDAATPKRILRDAYRDVLPAEILARGKMGFEVPVGELLRGPLEPMYRDVVTDARLDALGIAPAEARRLWQDHVDRRHERADILFALLALCWWQGRSGRS